MENDWVAQNLRRQRYLVEERQRQKRLQQSRIMSSQGRLDASPDSGLESRMNSVSLYSFLETPSNIQQPPPRRTFTVSTGGPKIINLKGATPPHSRKQSVSSEDDIPPIQTVCRENSNIENSEEKSGGTTDESGLETNVLEESNSRLDISEVVSNLDKFVTEPCRKNVRMKCQITRDKRGVDKGMFPIYYLHLENDGDRRIFLLAARRRKKSTTANYLISTDPTDLSRNGRSFVAKVRSNAVGTMFTIYDNGENPKKAAAIGDSVRQELAAVIYETNVLGFKGPRKMTIIIPGIYDNSARKELRPMSEKDSILERHKTHRMEELIELNNKQPQWNEDTQSYVLNFQGRVTQASVKNFQIVHAMNTDYVVMQFGRVDSEMFTMDFRFPLSPVQAFGIAMTSFHGKLACE